MSFECLHYQHTSEHSLVVAVEETVTSQSDVSQTMKFRAKDLPADACEASNTENFAISYNGHGTSGALELLAAQQGGLVEHRRSTGGRHDE
jgi:hypothetical protein